jgi:hypothetical protein
MIRLSVQPTINGEFEPDELYKRLPLDKISIMAKEALDYICKWTGVKEEAVQVYDGGVIFFRDTSDKAYVLLYTYAPYLPRCIWIPAVGNPLGEISVEQGIWRDDDHFDSIRAIRIKSTEGLDRVITINW